MACHAIRVGNAPSTFMRLMNQVLKPLISKSIVVYFNDILVFSPTREHHMVYLREVLEILQANTIPKSQEV